MKEDAVYVATKRWFFTRGYQALAGQPPNGCDNIPAIEIKTSINSKKGSQGSYKPDLVFANEKFLVIVECKPSHSHADLLKLLDIYADIERKRLLYNELTQRHIFDRVNLFSSYSSFELFENKLRFCLSHAGDPCPSEVVGALVFKSFDDIGLFIQPTSESLLF